MATQDIQNWFSSNPRWVEKEDAMFISNLPLNARVALRVANEAMTMYTQACVTQPEILFEDLKSVKRIGPYEREDGGTFLARYRPFGKRGREYDYTVRIVLRRDWSKTRFEAKGLAWVSREGKPSEFFPFEITWSGINDGPSVIFKRKGGGFAIF